MMTTTWTSPYKGKIITDYGQISVDAATFAKMNKKRQCLPDATGVALHLLHAPTLGSFGYVDRPLQSFF